MAQSTEVVADAATAVVVKRATGEAVPALRAEAERLRAAAHPGVVQVLASEGDAAAWELRLTHGGRPVDVVGPLPAAAVAGIVAAVAATLADLHDAGIVHGRIEASHVLLGGHGRPVLCGFGRGDAAVTAADDVAALGSLLAALLGSGPDMEPFPERRWWPRRAWSGWERRSLLLLADHACAEPATRRPTARRLAAALAEAMPADGVTPVPAASDDPLDALRASASSAAGSAPAGAGRLPALACALAGVVVLGVGTLRMARPEPSSSTAPLPVSSAPTPTTSVPPTTAVPPSTAVPPTTGTTTRTVATTESVRVEGTRVLVGDRRYEVGQPGDLVVLGDWDCDGGATPAVLRPSTGEVFVFSTWAADDDVVIGPSARVPDAITLVVAAQADGCATLLAARRDGSQVEVTGRAAA